MKRMRGLRDDDAVKYGVPSYSDYEKPRQVLIEYDAANPAHMDTLEAFWDENDKLFQVSGEFLPNIDYPVGDWVEKLQAELSALKSPDA